jgi:hypothetical protein
MEFQMARTIGSKNKTAAKKAAPAPKAAKKGAVKPAIKKARNEVSAAPTHVPATTVVQFLRDAGIKKDKAEVIQAMAEAGVEPIQLPFGKGVMTYYAVDRAKAFVDGLVAQAAAAAQPPASNGDPAAEIAGLNKQVQAMASEITGLRQQILIMTEQHKELKGMIQNLAQLTRPADLGKATTPAGGKKSGQDKSNASAH